MTMHLEGGCYCGKVRYALDGDPMMSGQCHCRECQYISGGSPNVFVAFPVSGVTYTKGAPKAFMREDLEGAVTREFCADCGSHLMARPKTLPAAIVKVGTLDNPAVVTPAIAMQMADAQPFHARPEGIPVFERFPG